LFYRNGIKIVRYNLSVDLEIDEKRSAIKVRGDDVNYPEVTDSDEDIVGYTNLNLDIGLIKSFHENVMKLTCTTAKYIT